MAEQEVFSVSAQFFQTVKSAPKLVEEEATIQITTTGPFSYKFNVLDNQDQILISADIASLLTIQFSLESLTLYFNVQFQDDFHNFNLIFHKADHLKNFVNVFVNSLFEQKNQKKVTSAQIPQIDQIIESMSIDNYEKNYTADDELFNEENQKEQATNEKDGGHNFLLRIAPLTDNAMIMRKYNDHCDLGIFSNDSKCKFKTKIAGITNDEGKPILTSDMITNNSDHGLILLDDNQQHQLYDLNLDRGVVVGHYETKDSFSVPHKVQHVIHQYQNDSTQPVFVGFNNKNTMYLDTRVENIIVNRSDYKGNNQFLCGITTRTGHIALGSADGIVRLYKEPCRNRATVNFNINVGEEPVVAIDVSPDEDWIVATCPSYVSTFTVLAQTTKKLAFDYPMKDEKTPVMRLVISQADQYTIAKANNGELLPFANAKFDVKGGKVIAIIASIGNALVSWNFKSILNNRIPKYSITYISDESIVDNHPLESSNILYMSQNQVSVAKRTKRAK